MVRRCVVVFSVGIFLGVALAGNLTLAQCRGGGGQGGTSSMGTTGTTGVLASTGGTASLLTGQGSLAYDIMMSRLVAQRIAQQQAMIAMRQQQLKAEKLAARKYRAEQTRAEVAESRARTRAKLAAQNGLPPPPPSSLVALNSVRR
jgi:hypothetical protein